MSSCLALTRSVSIQCKCIETHAHLTADMEKVEVLDLEGNMVDDLGAFVYLGWCPQLAILTLTDNPVAAEPSYHAQVPLISQSTLPLHCMACLMPGS